jgi:hypothetical protein
MFNAYGMEAREAFRLRGEQIDGSFQHGPVTYLVEANARTGLHGESPRVPRQDRREGAWARGLYQLLRVLSGWPSRIRSGQKLICMDGRDLYDVLDRGLALPEVLSRKDRRAVETGAPFTPVSDLYF